jgi:hypothetical protein
LVHVGEVIDSPTLPEKRFGLFQRERQNGLAEEFVVQLGVGQRAMDVAERFLDEARELFAVRQFDFNVGLIFGDGGVAYCGGMFADVPDCGIVDSRVGVFLNAGLAPDQSNGGAVINGEFALETFRDVGLVAEIEDERRDAEADGGDGRGRGVVLVMDLDGTVYGGVVYDAAWKGLVCVGTKFVIDIKSGGDFGKVV